MKKILLVLALVFGFFVMSYAQNMVTKLVFPATFDKIVYTTCNNSGSISSIDSGASAYWDLSSFGVLTDSIPRSI